MPENNFAFKKIFEDQTAFNPSDEQLNRLAKYMAEPEDEGIPAGYTYLGQFIDHDISLDSASDIMPWSNEIQPASIFNKRTPFLNLETIYDFENLPPGHEFKDANFMEDNSQTLLRLGDAVPGDSVRKPFVGKDLPRQADSPKAILVDKRNDENLAVAQTHLLFMRFHNAVVRHLRKGGAPDTRETFQRAREIVILHYQWIVLHDYLPKIVKKSVLYDVLASGNKFYLPESDSPFMPLEFSVAAFRSAHSMIRNSYNWNHIFNDDNAPQVATLHELTKFTGRGGLGGKHNLVSDWLINWYLFFKITGRTEGLKFNLAADINTKIATILGFLPDHRTNIITFKFKREASLAAFDLYRTRAMGLLSGQKVAEMILGTSARVLRPEQLALLLPAYLKNDFAKETPLWFYLLAEAEIEERGKRLGEVGSRIVVETLVELIKLSNPSALKDKFQPEPQFYVGEKEFGMRELLRFVAEQEKEVYGTGFDPLNPIGRERKCQC